MIAIPLYDFELNSYEKAYQVLKDAGFLLVIKRSLTHRMAKDDSQLHFLFATYQNILKSTESYDGYRAMADIEQVVMHSIARETHLAIHNAKFVAPIRSAVETYTTTANNILFNNLNGY